MSGFEYNPLDLEEVQTVDLAPIDDPHYRSFMASIYDSDADPQYKRLIDDHPRVAEEFKELATEALDDPGGLADRLDKELFLGAHDSLEQGEDDQRWIIRYEHHVEETPLPFVEETDVHPRVAKRATYGLLNDLWGRNGDDDQEKACLKYAFDQSWDESDADVGTYNTSREPAMYSELTDGDSYEPEIGSGGNEFEENVRQSISEVLGLPLRDPVFRIQKTDGSVTFKEMDIHTRVGPTPVIAELYTTRHPDEKQKQLRNYRDLYVAATGFQPETFLVTDEIVDWVKGDEGSQRRHRETDELGQMTAQYFIDRLEEMTDDL